MNVTKKVKVEKTPQSPSTSDHRYLYRFDAQVHSESSVIIYQFFLPVHIVVHIGTEGACA